MAESSSRILDGDTVNLPKVGIIMINWNNYEDTARCLVSLSNIQYPNYEIFVVDNGSTDGSYERLANEFSDIHVMPSSENLGFAGGCNLGIKRALEHGIDYIWLLNNDTILDEFFGSVSRVINLFEENPSYGVISPQILEYPDTNSVWFEKGVIDWKIGVGKHKEYPGEHGAHTENDYIPFCSAFIRREVFEEIGLLPEEYFLYLEDADFCIRLLENGYELCTDLQSTLFHKVSMSAGDSYDSVASYYVARNSYHLAKKFKRYRPKSFAITYSWWAVTRLAYRIFLRNFSGAKAWCEGLRDALLGRTKKGHYP